MASHKGSPALPLSPDPWMAGTVGLSMAQLVPTPESPSEQVPTAVDPMARLPLAGEDLQVVGQKGCGGQWGHIVSFVSLHRLRSPATAQLPSRFRPLPLVCESLWGDALVTPATTN